MKHKWQEVNDYRGHKVAYCERCGQEWPNSEGELLTRVDAMPCPRYLEIRGPFWIEYKSVKWDWANWVPANCNMAATIRDAITLVRQLHLKNVDIQLVDFKTKGTLDEI